MDNHDQQTTGATCPLCAQANQCAIAKDDQATSCWCQHAIIDSEQLSTTVSENSSCICPTCAKRLAASQLAQRVKEIL